MAIIVGVLVIVLVGGAVITTRWVIFKVLYEGLRDLWRDNRR